MSFSTKRAVRKLSATSRTKLKHSSSEDYSVKDLPSLRRKRTIALNRIQKALEIGYSVQRGDSPSDLFFSYCDQIDKYAIDFEHAHFSILELSDVSEECDEDENIRTRFDETFFEIMSIRRSLTKPDLNSTRNSSDNANYSSLSRVRLPKIQLPIFSGDVKKWPEFFDMYNALIHNCSSLTDVEKFHYLISSLRDDPLALIRVFPITDNHYVDAYDALVARYQNKRELAFTCWRDILNINFKSQNASDFRRTLDCVDENLSILKGLNLPIDKWEFIMVYHVLSKLDTKLRREFEEKSSKCDFPKYQDLKEFLNSKCEAILRDKHFDNNSKLISTTKELSKPTPNYSKRPHATYSLTANNSIRSKSTNLKFKSNSEIKCSFCSASHSISQCNAFLSKSVDERMAVALDNKWCYNCLKQSHQIKDCTSIFRCLKCKHKHHTLLHKDRIENKSLTNRADPQSVSLVAKQLNSNMRIKYSPSVATTVLLATAIVNIEDSDGNSHSFRALFDTGSQNNFITYDAMRCLKLKPVPCDANVSGLGGAVANISGTVRCNVSSNHNNSSFDIDLHVISKICGDQPISKLNTIGWSHIQSLSLADPGFDIPGPIDILLGADVFAESLLNQRIKGNANQPFAINSVFGWLLLGKTPLVTSSLIQYLPQPDDLSAIVQRFWEIDNVPQASSLTPDEVACEKMFVTDHYRDSSGRYGVRLPFKQTIEPNFDGSRDIALRRLKAIERRLSRDPILSQQYCSFMNDYRESGHMSLVPADETNQGKYYIPHHCIVKPDSATTKLRVVFDASAKDAQGKSLNDTLLIGPKLQSNILIVLLQFRLHHIVFMADIRQMYRQILVHSDHRDYQRILWRSSPDQPIQEFKLNTVTYGVSSAPFLAIRTIQQLAEDEGSQFPLAQRILKADIYVDDVVSGCDTLGEALEAKLQLTKLLSLGQFQLRKWASSVPALLSDLSPEECLLDPKTFSDDQPSTLKVLGLKWDPSTDTFLFDVKPSNRSCTKRVILSEISKIFDPLGFLSAITIKAKCLLQKLWILGISWDETPPYEITNVWSDLCDQLPTLQDLRIPRTLVIDNVQTYELHGFCDSSEVAYGATIYLRAVRNDGFIQIRLSCAKARVAPIKKISLPRLELCAAVLLTDLAKQVLDTYRDKIHINSIFLWSDSTIVLSWLRSHSSRWTTFVANRVSHIQDSFPSEFWHHVASHDNPADVCSRGQLPLDLISNTLWWFGPSWLSSPADQWPISKLPVTSNENDIVKAEERKSIALVASTTDNSFYPIDYLLNRYSSLDKIIRIISYIRRFLYNARHPLKRQHGSILTEGENHESLLLIVKSVQNSAFSNEISRLKSRQLLPKPFRKLNPFLDEEGILRVGGRLSRAGLEFEQKHPALLPSDDPFTFKLIESIHRKYCHTGQNTTHFLILQRFWILSAKRAIRHCLSKCIRCYKTQPKPIEPYMSDLPSFRVNQAKPFSIVGVDFGGPFRIKLGKHRGAKLDKAYLCLFVCLVTKAVHLEVVSSLSTDGFLAALRRFVGRRGRCNVIHADCGTNFIGASNYLSLLEQVSQAECIKFDFNPPSAPHFGGAWEILIKAAKSHLYRVVGNQVLTFEELTTLFVQIEAVLNSRPLCPMSADPNDLNVLTPGHFLTLEPLTAVPDTEYSGTNLNRLNRWQLIQSFLQSFWMRWRNEYLHSLTQRAKWTKLSKPLPLNAIVLIKDDNRAPLHWPVGRITELFPGPDGIVRVAAVKTKDSLITRPLVKLCPLPTDSN